MVQKSGKEKFVENEVQKPEGLLTVKEYRSQLARVLLNKRKKIKEEIDEIQRDESISDEEKDVKLGKLYEELHKGFRQNAVAKFDNGDYYNDREYRVIYVKNFQIKEIERQLKDEKDPEKRQILEEKLKYIKDFYESEKCLDRNHDAEMQKIIEEMKSKNEWIDWLRGEWENGLYDGRTIDEICSIISQYGFMYNGADDGDEFVEKIKTMNDGSYEKFIQSVVDGGGIKVDMLWRADSYPYWAWYPEVFEKIGGLKERQSYKLFCNGSTESEERLQKELEAIQKTGGLKEGCTVTIDFYLCRGTSKHQALIKGLIDDANKKGINSTIGIWYDNPYGDDTYKSYDSCYGSSFGIKDIVKKNRERITQRKKNKMDGKPVLEIDDDTYNDIELTSENLKTIIDTEGKKLKNSILYDYDIYKEKETEERVKSRIDSFLEGALKFCSKQVGMTPKMVGGMVLGIGGKILEVYKHPYYLNGNTKDPAFTIDSFNLGEEGLIIKTRYTTGTSGTWVGGMKLDDQDYSTQTYLITKDGKCEFIDQGSYNMRDLYND